MKAFPIRNAEDHLEFDGSHSVATSDDGKSCRQCFVFR